MGKKSTTSPAGKSLNRALSAAKKSKKDEFYTQSIDIQKLKTLAVILDHVQDGDGAAKLRAEHGEYPEILAGSPRLQNLKPE